VTPSLTELERAVVDAAVKSYRYMRRDFDSVRAWIDAGDDDADRAMRETSVKVEIMEQSEKVGKVLDEAVKTLLERRERTADTVIAEGHEPIGPTHVVAKNVSACVMGPKGQKWIRVAHTSESYGFTVSASYTPDEARAFAALLLRFADEETLERHGGGR
jgi:hypothetical protein